ncbi:serine/threonine-protein kinase [Aquisphaera insulae]|uniref:serine/threonine-protein kinase n=1 Tax=Aquisphaera insulae TaxID=2712864 RepID=UPI0013EA05F3|nr:serine/threonine-protein kinase [Aquisphaera insulae]
MSDATSDCDPFEIVAESFLERYRAGERPSIEELAARHPELAGQIRRLLPAMVRVEQDLTIDPEPGPAARAMPAASSGPSRQLGDYRILGEIGRGGMGTVYEAEQVSLGRRVALKVLPGHAVGDRRAENRFRREAKAAARLHHTNIVPVFEVGREGDVAFYAMQLIVGQGLDQVIEELKRLRSPDREGRLEGTGPAHASTSDGHPSRPSGRIAESLLGGRLATEGPESLVREGHEADDPAPTERLEPAAILGHESAWPDGDGPPPRRPADLSGSAVLPGGTHVSKIDTSGRRQPFFRSVAQIGRQVAQGLAYAHARGVVHRDIKPSNLLLDTAGVVWITDFGLAKAEEDGLTATGDILGTLRYMPPERFRGEGDARADIYALGMTLYELLTLRPAYRSSDRLKLIEQVKNEEPTRPRSLDDRIPRDLETIVLKALDKLPERRYPTAEAMAEDLRRFLADEPIKARQVSTTERYWRWARRNPVVAILGGVLTALLIAVTIGSLVTASHFKTIALSESLANRQSQLDRNEALQARRLVTEERDKSLQLSASLALEKGIALGQGGQADHGLHWMLEALRTAPENASDFRKAVRWNLGAWLGQVHRPLRIVEAAGECSDLGFSPDGATFATGFNPRDRERATPIHLWDTATGALRKTFPGAVSPFVFGPDGKVLFAFTESRAVVAVAVASGSVLWTGTPLPGGTAFEIAVSADGSTVIAALHEENSAKLRLTLLDATTGSVRGEPLELTGTCAVAPDAKTVAIHATQDGEMRLALHDLPSGRRLLSWPTGETTKELSKGRWWGGFSPDGTSLYATVSTGGMLFEGGAQVSRFWDAGRGQPLSPIMASTTYFTYAPAGDRILTLTDNLWLLRRAPDGQVRGSGLSSAGDGHDFRTHPDGLTVVTHASDKTYRIWQVSPEAEPTAADRSDRQATTADTRPERESLALSLLSQGFVTDGRVALTEATGVSGRQQVRVTDLATGRALGRPTPHYPGWHVRGLALSRDGSLFATGSNPPHFPTGEVRIWETGTGRLRVPPIPQINFVVALAFRPDGKVLATGDFSGLVRRWDTATGEEIGRPLPQGEIVLSLAYSPDGTKLAVGLSNDHTGKPGIRLWDADAGTRIGELLPSSEPVRRIEFFPDGTTLLAAHDHYTQLWDASQGRAVGGPMADETSGGIRPDGRAFLTLGRDGGVTLRDASTGGVLARLLAVPSPALCSVFRSDGGLVAVGFQDGSVRLCDPATSQPIGPPRFMEYAVNKVAFTLDGQSVAGIDVAGNTRVWRVPSPLVDEGPDDLRLRIEARTGMRMEPDRSIARLDAPAWRDRLERLGHVDPAALRREVDPAWHATLAREAEQMGNTFAAIWHLDRLIATHPEDWSLYARRARARSRSDRLEEAAADYDRALRHASKDLVLDVQAHAMLDCTWRDRWAEALWYLDRLIASRSNDALLHEERAAVYGKLGREADRVAELARVYELGPDAGLALPRAEELGRAGRWAEAADLLARCGRRGAIGRDLAQAWAVACLKAGDHAGYAEACAAFAGRLGPDPTVVWNALAEASVLALAPAAHEDLRRRIEQFERRLAVSPAPSPIYRHLLSCSLGGLLLRAGRFDDAIARLNEGLAASKVPELPTDWAYLAVAWSSAGKPAEARKWLDRLRTWQVDASATYWDLQELALIRGEAESLLLDAEFPSEPFAGPSAR